MHTSGKETLNNILINILLLNVLLYCYDIQYMMIIIENALPEWHHHHHLAETRTAVWRFLLSQSVRRGVVKRAAPAKMAAELHPRSGKLIGLSNSNRTAQRNQPVQEFNHGLVLSREPLRDRDVFTVRIDKKVNKSATSDSLQSAAVGLSAVPGSLPNPSVFTTRVHYSDKGARFRMTFWGFPFSNPSLNSLLGSMRAHRAAKAPLI